MTATEFDALAAMAGGDETDLAVAEIRADVTAAHRRIFAAYPVFSSAHPTKEGANPRGTASGAHPLAADQPTPDTQS